MQADARVLPQCTRESVIQRPYALRWRGDVGIEESDRSFTAFELTLDVGEGFVLRQRMQGRHEWITLLAAFPLPNLMGLARVVKPRVRARGSVKLPRVRQQRLESRPRKERAEHGTPRDVVKGSDCIDRENSGTRGGLSGCTQEAADSLAASTGAKSELVGQACRLQVWREVLRQDLADESAQDIADDKGAHTAIGLAQRYEAPDPNAC